MKQGEVLIELDEIDFDESEDLFSNEGEEQDENNEADGEHDMSRSVRYGIHARSILPLAIRPALFTFPLKLAAFCVAETNCALFLQAVCRRACGWVY